MPDHWRYDDWGTFKRRGKTVYLIAMYALVGLSLNHFFLWALDYNFNTRLYLIPFLIFAVWLMADLGFAIIDWIYDKIFNR